MALPSLEECAAVFDRLTPVLLNAAAGSVVVLAVAGLATLVLRRSSAAARHEVWLLGFAGVLLLPILSAALPGWHVLPLQGEGRRASHLAEVITSSPIPTPVPPAAQPSAPPPANPTHDKETIMNAKSDLPSAGSPQPVVMTPVDPWQANPSPVSPAPRLAPTRAGESEGLPPRTAWLLLLLCWPLGSLMVLGRVFLGHLSLWLLRRRCMAVTRGELFDLLERLRKDFGLRRPVELLRSPLRTMPMTWGLWRARLLVPEQAAAWPVGQRRDVLLHELGHVRRRDCLTHLLSQVTCALYWFNPLAWLAARRMQIERERACDDLVLNSGVEASSYARHLLQSVSPVPAFRLAGAAAAMARPSTLEERMRAILDARLNRRALTARGSLAAALVLLSALVPVAVLKAQPAPAQDPPAIGGGGPAQPIREGRDGSAGSPATRPAGGPVRPGFAGSRAGGRGSFGGGAAGLAAPVLGDGPTCTFDATVYDVRLPVDQIGKLDVDALAKTSETAEGFEKALAALGATKPMYRANQSVRLSGDMMTIGSNVPVVTGSRMSDRGQAINTVTYQSVGAIFSIAGKAGAPGGMNLDLGIEVSSSSDGGAAVAENVKAPIMRRATLSHKGPVQPRKPFVVVSVDGGSVDKDGKAVAYIGRVTLGEPQPPAPK